MQDLDLSAFFHTRAQANDFLVRLSNCSEEIYKNDFNFEKSLTDNFGLEKKDKLVSFLRNNNINTTSATDIKNFLDKLQEQITKLPMLSLTLAFEPNEETLNLINEWFAINTKKQFIFDITINPNLLAGVAINFNGKYLDYSVNKKFDKVLKDALIEDAKNPPPLLHQTPTANTLQS